MFILTALFIIAVILVLTVLTAVGAIGAGAILIFGDVIVAVGVICFIIYKLVTKKKA